MTHLVRAHEGAHKQLPGLQAWSALGAESVDELDGLLVSEVVFTGHDDNPGHTHVEQEVFFFLDPVTVRLADPDETLNLDSGDCLHLSSNRFHRINSSTHSPARAIIIKTRCNK